MKRNFITLVFGLSVLVLIHASAVLSQEFEEGKHYNLIEINSESQQDEQIQSTEDGAVDDAETSTADNETSNNEISVVEYFSYGCTHCYRLEQFIDAWLETKDKEVTFSRVAAPTRRDWVPHARAFYVLEKLGVTEKVHALIFRGIYVNNENMVHKSLLKRVITGVAEIEPEKFEEVWGSDEIAQMVQNAARELSELKISATPTIVVDGTYLITPETAGDLGLMFDIVDFLVERVKSEREMEESGTSNEHSS